MELVALSKKAGYLIDFPDQIYLTLLWDLELPKYDRVLVDEVQDSNPARQEVFLKLQAAGSAITLVGDRFQAIFGFTGADTEAMDRLPGLFNAKVLPLTINYRCSLAVIKCVQRYNPLIQAAPGAIEGSETYLADTFDPSGKIIRWFEDPSVTLDNRSAGLSRNNATLVSHALAMLARGIPCHVEGRKVGEGLTALIKKLMGKAVMAGKKEATLDDLSDKLDAWEVKELAKIDPADMAKLDAISDKTNSLRVFIEKAAGDSIAELVMRIEALFSDTSKTFTLCTGHRSKGREWDNVYWIDQSRYQPSPYARLDWQLEQETNLAYVMASRARVNIIHVATIQDKD